MNTIAHSPPAAGRPLQAPTERLIAGVRAAWRRSVLLRALAWAPALLAASGSALGAGTTVRVANEMERVGFGVENGKLKMSRIAEDEPA